MRLKEMSDAVALMCSQAATSAACEPSRRVTWVSVRLLDIYLEKIRVFHTMKGESVSIVSKRH